MTEAARDMNNYCKHTTPMRKRDGERRGEEIKKKYEGIVNDGGDSE